MESTLSKKSPIEEIFNSLSDEKKGVRVGDNIFLGKSFASCFKGSEAEQWLIENVKGLTSKEAFALGNQLIKTKYMYHVSTNLLPFTRACFYRFEAKKLEAKVKKQQAAINTDQEDKATFKKEGENNECINCMMVIAEEQAEIDKMSEEEKLKQKEEKKDINAIIEETKNLNIDETDHLFAIRNIELKSAEGKLTKMIDIFQDKDIIVLALLRHFG